MSQQRRGLLFNGTTKAAAVRPGGAFDLQESPIIVASSGLTAPVGIQYLLNEIDEWVDVMVNDAPLQLTPASTFVPLTVQGAYRIKPGEATGSAVVWFTEVTSVPEWSWGSTGCGDSGGGAPAVTLPLQWTNLDGTISGQVGESE